MSNRSLFLANALLANSGDFLLTWDPTHLHFAATITDSTTREALRRELERLIDESEREINTLRQKQQGGNQ